MSTAFLSMFLLGLNYVGEDKKPRPMIVEVEAGNAEFSPEPLQEIFTRSKVSFESRGFKRGDTTSIRYQVSLPPSISLQDVTNLLMTSGLPLKSVFWESQKGK
jgi:hypothetical protein